MSDHPVVEQARDNSLINTEPVLLKSTIVGVVGAVASILVIGGYIDESQREALVENVGVIVPALIIILQILGAIWSRMSAYAPKTAAKIAVVSAERGAPTLLPPP